MPEEQTEQEKRDAAEQEREHLQDDAIVGDLDQEAFRAAAETGGEPDEGGDKGKTLKEINVADLPKEVRDTLIAAQAQLTDRTAEVAKRETTATDREAAVGQREAAAKPTGDGKDAQPEPFKLELKSGALEGLEDQEKVLAADIGTLGAGIVSIHGLITKLTEAVTAQGAGATKTQEQIKAATERSQTDNALTLLNAGVKDIKEQLKIDVTIEDLSDAVLAWASGIIRKNGGKVPSDLMLRVARMDPDIQKKGKGEGGGPSQEAAGVPQTLTRGSSGGGATGEMSEEDRLILADLT